MPNFQGIRIANAVNRCCSLNRGLVSWWSPLPQVSGTGQWYDLSGYGRDGTLIGITPGTDWIASPFGKALDFDGVNDRVEAPGYDNWLEQTVSIWLWTTGSSDSWPRVIEKGLNSEWTLNFNVGVGSKKKIILQYGDASTFLTSVSDLDTGTWRHVAFTIDATALESCSLYIDGVEEHQAFGSTKTPTKTGDIRIGGTSTANTDFQGRLADVRIYNRALSAVEILALYQDSLMGYRRTLNRAVRGVRKAGTAAAGNRRRRFFLSAGV